jgi:hypothetical protein
MVKRYEIRHHVYGRGYRYQKLETALKELKHCVPPGEWFVYDRETGETQK